MKKTKIISLFLAGALLVAVFCGCASVGNGKNNEGSVSIYSVTNQGSYDTVTNVNVAEVVAQTALTYTYEVTCYLNYTYTYNNPFGGWYGSGRSSTMSGSATYQGTAFCINEEGYLITNAHVINLESASSYSNLKYTGRDIYVNLYNQSEKMPCDIVAYNETLDLALLKIKSSGQYYSGNAYQLTGKTNYAVFFAHDDPTEEGIDNRVDLNYGEWAAVVGNARGYGIAITTGVLSAPFRYFKDGDTYIKAIQTDAAINSGNSGGPLVNAYAAVLGVVSFKVVANSTESMGYAIPTYVVTAFLDSLSSSPDAGTKSAKENGEVADFTALSSAVVYTATRERKFTGSESK